MRYLPVALVGAMFCLCIVGGAGLILVRHKVTKAAFETKHLETEWVKLERKHQYLQSRLAQLEQPAYLMAKVGNQFKLPPAHLIVKAELVPTEPLIQHRLLKPLEQEPLMLSLDLAFLATTTH